MDITDIERFEKHLFEPESSFEILLRGHLWIENLVERILEVNIVNPGILDFDRIGFRQKIDIAQAFGFIAPWDGHAFKALNRLRNKLAHDLMTEPSESEIGLLVATLAGPAKAAFDAVLNHPVDVRQSDKFATLRYWFVTYIAHLDYLHASMRYYKENQTKLAQVTGARYGSRLNGGKELSEEEARGKFNLEAPPIPDEIWISVIDRNYRRPKTQGN
jgi:hypothetical protein